MLRSRSSRLSGAPTSRGARSIKRILDAAATIFGTEGFQGASMHAVARAAGVSKGLLHYHFRSKEHLLLEAQRATFRQIHARFDERARQGDAGLGTALEGLDALWQSVRDMRTWAPFMVETISLIQTTGPLRDDLEAFYQEIDNLLQRGIEEVLGQERLQIPAPRLARVIRATVHGLVVELALARSPSDLTQLDQVYADFREMAGQFILHPDTRR